MAASSRYSETPPLLSETPLVASVGAMAASSFHSGTPLMASTGRRHTTMIDSQIFTQPDDVWDLALVVESGGLDGAEGEDDERRVYTCRCILASVSPVWKRMLLAGELREKDAAAEVRLPGKSVREMVELLLCLSPAVQNPITDDNVMYVLPLADEYEMMKLKKDCELYLLAHLDQATGAPIQQLCIAQKYKLGLLLERAVELAAELPGPALEEHEDYDQLSKDTQQAILRHRVTLLEKQHDELLAQHDRWLRKCEQLEECLKKVGCEKMTVKRVLDDIAGAWELKGSDSRCIDPVHIYGPRDLTCETCSKQMQTYIQAKVHFLLNCGSTSSAITWPDEQE